MAERVEMPPATIKVVKKVIRTPAKKLISDAEKNFVKETKERFEKFGDEIFLSAKQFAWLEKIAGRADKKAEEVGSDEVEEEGFQEDEPV